MRAMSSICPSDAVSDDYRQRFGGIERLYGQQAAEWIRAMRVCVIGLGGVGSWAVEALARSGVGRLLLIDFDAVAASNVNRQIHALSSTMDQKKTLALRQRIGEINPYCEVEVVDDFITDRNLFDCLPAAAAIDYVIDAIDSIRFKAALIYYCKRNKIPVIMTGAAGGLTDPTQIMIKDLTRTCNDPLAAKVRSQLRTRHGYSRNPKRYFGVECVFSAQHHVYPRGDGSIGHQKPGIHGVHLDCSMGYGSASFVTGAMGFAAVARVIERHLLSRQRGAS